MSNPSLNNNCNRPLSADASFTGPWESSAGALMLAVFIASPTLGLLTIQQSNNRGTTIQLTDTYNIDNAALDAMNVFRVPSGFASFRVIFHNYEGNQTYLSLNTYLEDFYTSNNVIATISGVVDISGNVVSTPAMSSAQLRHTPLVVGHWYQVASIGDTSGAVWAEMGAIWVGESTPPIGRQFQCLYAGYGTGTCYDITTTTGVAVVDVSGNTYDTSGYLFVNAANIPIVTGSGGYPQVNVCVANFTNGNPLDVVIDTDGNTIKIDQSSSDTNGVVVVKPLPEGTHTIGNVNIRNSFQLNTFTYADISGNWVSDSADLTVYSLADIYMLSAGSVTSTLGMTFIGQYSPDNIHWFNSGNTLILTSSEPQGIAVGILTASPYIRLVADPANASGDVATDVSLWIPTKAI